MQIRLLPTHAPYAKIDEDICRSPENFRLLEHQVQTFKTLKNHEADIILHPGMTGGGKSLAGQLPLLSDPSYRILATFPTNELIRDQERQFSDTIQRWRQDRSSTVLNARTLDELSDHEGIHRRDALFTKLRSTHFLLTNPDIVHYIFSGRYLSHQQNPFYMVEQLPHYQQITYDEFHLFDQAQVSAILAQIIFLQHYAGRHKPNILLQSATPDNALEEAFERAGLSIAVIPNSYSHSEGTTPVGYRTILQGVDLILVPGSPDDWLLEHAESDLRPALRTGHTRVAGLFNSVVKVMGLHPELAANLSEFQVLHNTGLTPPSMRKASHDADVVLGTATVDVGVDLKINYLVFEAHDAATFKQRLGRLGRHSSFVDREGQTREFHDFKAVACVPAWIYAQLEEKLQTKMNREAFFNIIDEVLPKPHHIKNYNRLWGWFPGYDLCYRLGHPTIKAQHGDIQIPTAQAMEHALNVKFENKTKRHREITKNHRFLHEALTAFRGSSPFTVVVIKNHYIGVERYQFYDLLRLARKVDFRQLDLDEVKHQALAEGLTKREWERQKPIGTLQWLGVLNKARKLYLTMSSDAWEAQATDLMSERIATIKGLELVTKPAANLGDIHLKIIKRSLAVRLELGMNSSEVRQRYKLGFFFPLYDFQTFDNQHGCIALGRDALMLDAALAFRRNDKNFIIT